MVGAAHSGPLLSFARVGRRRREGAREALVLSDVSFELHAGARMGIYGERRSGKSTLLRLAAGLELADAGAVRVAGRDPAEMSADERTRLLRGPLALLSADGWAPSPRETVMDHVAMSAGSAGLSLRQARRAAVAALDRTGVAGIGGEECSGALAPVERARVALARAIVREPRLLLVDEPAPLPSLLERERFCTLLRNVAEERGMAMLVVSEDLGVLAGMTMLASLSAGELCTTREPGAVVDLPRRRAREGA